MMTGDNAGWGFWNHVISNAWEPQTFEVLNRFLSKDRSYVDIGAWVGPTVLFGSQLSKHCYAFEPDPHAFRALQTNLKLNPGIANVEAYPMAVGAETGKVRFGTKSKPGDSMSSLLFSKKGSWEVDSITLRDAFCRFNIRDCNFIKMDIEGGEQLVIPASKGILQELQPTLYLSLHTAWITDKNAFFHTLSDVLSVYKNIYTASGKKIPLSKLSSLPKFSEILATNSDW